MTASPSLPSLAAALPSAAVFGVTSGRGLSPSLRVRRLPLPTVPPPGDLRCVGGFLLARAAPFDRQVQSVVWAGWGYGHVTDADRLACAGRTREARQRLSALALATPVPPALWAALALPAMTDPLVVGLAALYDLTPHRPRRRRVAVGRSGPFGPGGP